MSVLQRFVLGGFTVDIMDTNKQNINIIGKQLCSYLLLNNHENDM